MAVLLKSSIADVSYHIDYLDFEGPLDKLLNMLKESNVEIKDLFVSNITQQYLDYVAKMDKADFEYCSEYVQIAAEILRLKAHSLLPYEPSDGVLEGEGFFDGAGGQGEFIMMLEDFSVYREKAEKLKSMEILNRHYRDPEYTEKDFNITYKNFNLEKLINVFTKLLEKEEFAPYRIESKTIVKDRFNMLERAQFIATLLRTHGEVKFTSLYDDAYTRTEFITTFLAVLSVAQQQIATITQDGLFGEIMIKYNAERDPGKLEVKDEYK